MTRSIGVEMHVCYFAFGVRVPGLAWDGRRKPQCRAVIFEAGFLDDDDIWIIRGQFVEEGLLQLGDVRSIWVGGRYNLPRG